MEHTPVDSSGASRGSYRSYTTGFILSLVLTALSFGVVMFGDISRGTILVVIVAAAIAQILVHLHYFLHLDTSSEARWNLLALLFTILIMALFVVGTLWIMYNLHYRMMY